MVELLLKHGVDRTLKARCPFMCYSRALKDTGHRTRTS